jgi:zona occludens toxin (predicted ATPase)
MITLITGVPGSGKTLRTIQIMDEFVKEGRPVWTNIKGIKLKGVQPLPEKWEGHWQDYDDGTVFVIDEVQEIWRGTGKSGMTKNKDVQELELHRHRGMDFVLTTQHPTFVESHVRKLVGKHEHINRPRGSKHVGISSKDHYFDVTTETATADFNIWKHPKKYYGCYESATVHTHKFQVPKKVLVAVGAMVLLAVTGVTLLSGTFILSGDSPLAENENQDNSAVKVKLPFHLSDWGNTITRAPVSGCISSANHCTCYNPTGQPLQLDTGACFKHMEHILPRSIIITRGGEQRPPPRGPGSSPLSL